MPLILDKSTITSLGIIRPWHVSQSVDAFTGIEAYDITISGSLITIGPFLNNDGNGNLNIDSPSRTLFDLTSIESINWNARRLYDVSGTPVLDWNNGLTASSFNVDDIVINNSGFINGSPILTQAGATGYVTSVNGIFPTNGNVSTGITAVITGDSASLVVSSSGDPTGSIGEGTVWVISGDPNPNNNGDSYIFAAGPPGVWYPIAPLDVPAADARYILKNGDDSHTGSLYISGSSIELSLSGNLVVHDQSNNVPNINSDARILYDPLGNQSINWNIRNLVDSTSTLSTDWEARNLSDVSSFLSLDWNNRQLIQSDGATVTLDWENAIFTGSVHGTSSWADSASYAIGGPISINGFNTLYSSNTSDFGTSDNNFFGFLAGNSAVTVQYSNFLGSQAGDSATDAYNSNFLGYRAGYLAVNANSSNFMGPNAGNAATNAANSNFIGGQAGLSATNANLSNFIGYNAGNGATNAVDANFIGDTAGVGAINSFNSNFIGTGAGYTATDASNSNFIGPDAGNSATSASNSNFVGAQAGANSISASYSNLIGYRAGVFFTSNQIDTNNIIIGTNISLPDGAKNSVNIGGIIYATGSYATPTGNPLINAQANSRVGIGTFSPTETLHVNGNVRSRNTVLSTTTNTSPLANLTVDADSVGIARWEANFLTNRNLFIDNLADGQSVTVYVRNTNSTSKTIFISASTTTSGYNSVSCSKGGNTSVSSVSLFGSGGAATIWVANVGGVFIGSIS